MSNDPREKWDLSQFLATLNYFGEIPFIGSFRWLQQWLGQSSNFPGSTLSAMKSKVLVVDSECAGLFEPITSELSASKSQMFGFQLSRVLQQKLGASIDFLFDDGFCQVSKDARWNDLQREKCSFRESTVKNSSNLKKLVQSVDTVVLVGTAGNLNQMREVVARYQEAVEGLDTDVATQNVFDFSDVDSDLAAWGSLDDVVMGGVSQGRFFSRSFEGACQAVFAGTVSTGNSGGFSSVRTRNFEPPYDFSGWSGFQLRVKGDGQRYKFIARNSGGWDSPAYIYGVDTVKDRWTSVRVPFESMVPTFRARSIADAPAFNPAKVFSFQLMLSKFEADRQLNPQFSAGPFELSISDISLYRPRRGLPLVVVGSCDETIRLQQQLILDEAKVASRLIDPTCDPASMKDSAAIAAAVSAAIAPVLI